MQIQYSLAKLFFYSFSISLVTPYYKCEHKACSWSEYTEDVDWGFYSKENNDCTWCQTQCSNGPNCGAVECGNNYGYCIWWKNGKCDYEDSGVLDVGSFGLTCRSLGVQDLPNKILEAKEEKVRELK